MLEPRFNLDTLAMLLNIPPQKTLLRRHLTTNFNNLVGAQAQQEKREYTQAAGYTPLSITAKVKVSAADVGLLCLSPQRNTPTSSPLNIYMDKRPEWKTNWRPAGQRAEPSALLFDHSTAASAGKPGKHKRISCCLFVYLFTREQRGDRLKRFIWDAGVWGNLCFPLSRCSCL